MYAKHNFTIYYDTLQAMYSYTLTIFLYTIIIILRIFCMRIVLIFNLGILLIVRIYD